MLGGLAETPIITNLTNTTIDHPVVWVRGIAVESDTTHSCGNLWFLYLLATGSGVAFVENFLSLPSALVVTSSVTSILSAW